MEKVVAAGEVWNLAVLRRSLLAMPVLAEGKNRHCQQLAEGFFS